MYLSILQLDDSDNPLGQRKVADLDLGGSGPADQQIQRCQAKMAHALGVHVLQPVQNLRKTISLEFLNSV
jgi:hypothetical protein